MAIAAIDTAGEGKSARSIGGKLNNLSLLCWNLHIDVELFDGQSVFHVFRSDDQPNWAPLLNRDTVRVEFKPPCCNLDLQRLCRTVLPVGYSAKQHEQEQ